MTVVDPGAKMKPKFRFILQTAIDEGVRSGYRRAFKHVENPSEGAIVDNIVTEIFNSLDTWFDFDDDFNG